MLKYTPAARMAVPLALGIALLITGCNRDDQLTRDSAMADTFTADVAAPVMGSNGVVIPAGAPATVQVTRAKRGANVNDEPELGIVVQSITVDGKRYAISSDVTSAEVVGVRAGGSSDVMGQGTRDKGQGTRA